MNRLSFVIGCAAAVAATGCPRTGPTTTIEEPAEPEQLATHGALVGTVIDIENGEPVSVAEVVLTGPDDYESRATTDTEGRYQLINIPPGSYRVVASFGDLRATFEDVVVVAGSPTPLRFQLDSRRDLVGKDASRASNSPRGAITGVVRESAGGPGFDGATVEAERDGNSVITISGAGGKFRVIGLQPGVYNLSIYYTLVDKGTVEVRRGGIEVEPFRETMIEMTLDTETQR